MQTNHTPPERLLRHRSLAVSVRLLVCSLLTAHCTLSAGCRSNNRYDLIEAELRTRERELADARAFLDQSRNLLRAYEASQSRGASPTGPQPGGGGPFLAVKEISIGRGTGGVDEDGAPGDEGLLVVVVPRDEDGSAVKVPGRALVPADKLRPTWKSGLISSGYFIAVPWQTLPSSDRVRVAVRLITTDGRSFEADRDVSVKPPLPPRGGGGVPTIPRPPGGGRQPLFPEMPPPGVPSAIPPGTEELPPPALAPTERGAILLPPVKQ